MKKKLLFCATLCLCAFTLTACNSSADKEKKNTLTLLNYGKYIDTDVLKMFEAETGVSVIYEEYESPEEMYTKYKAGSIDYDLICTSDYMVQKLIEEDEVLEIDFDALSEYKNINPDIIDASAAFDPEHKYSLPYFYGTVGILYNSENVSDSEVDTWQVLWDEKYKDSIIMENSVRDCFLVPLKLLGYSLNTTDSGELDEALELLYRQKPLVYAYYVDETGDQMAAGNADLAVVYSGEAAYAQELSEELSYHVPKEGSNLWIDSWFMPKTCTNTENAQKFLDFLCRKDVAALNFDYVYYATPNTAVFDELDEEIQNDTTIFPSEETLDNCEVYTSLSETDTRAYNYLWKKLKCY